MKTIGYKVITKGIRSRKGDDLLPEFTFESDPMTREAAIATAILVSENSMSTKIVLDTTLVSCKRP